MEVTIFYDGFLGGLIPPSQAPVNNPWVHICPLCSVCPGSTWSAHPDLNTFKILLNRFNRGGTWF